jgi:hypothetical protein
LKLLSNTILTRKQYFKPEITRIILDNSISFIMMSPLPPPNPPGPRGGGSKGADEPFQSPFGDKPFS